MLTKQEIKEEILKAYSPKPAVIEVVFDEENGEYNSYVMFEEDSREVFYSIYDPEDGECLAETAINASILKLLNKHLGGL